MHLKDQTNFKQKIAITKIGAFRFWLGVLYGLLNAALFFCFVFLFTETVDLSIVLWGYDVPKVLEANLFYQKLFLITFSIAFGNSAMIRCWFSIPSKYFNRNNRFSSIKVTKHSLFVEYMVWYATMAYINHFLFQFPEADLAIYETFGYVFIGIPIYLFFFSWTEIIRTIKAQSWMWKAFVFSYVLAALVSFVDLSQYKIAEIAFKKIHNEEMIYVEHEVVHAKRAYGIEFSVETILSLKELRTERALDLLEKTRVAFKTNGKVSLDTIILEKILIHNFKGYYKDNRQSYQYIFPFQVYEQLRKVDPKSHEATELLNILAEFYKLCGFMNDRNRENNDSTSDYIKSYVLEDNIFSPNIYFNYRMMQSQVFFLLHKLEKLGTYDHHPLFDTVIPFLPPPILNNPSILYNPWVKEHFPELQN